MLNVLTPDEVLAVISSQFSPLKLPAERVSLGGALGRVLKEDIIADEFVPDFCRSTVDGYALRAADTFGCSDSLPALLKRTGEVFMGEEPAFTVSSGECAAIPTGGALPQGADAVQMIEFSEDYGDGTIGIFKAAAPGNNLILRGDDVKPGDVILRAGRRLEPQDIGALAAAGITEVSVAPKVRIAVISTGDELVAPDTKPAAGQVRDVNSSLVCSVLLQAGALPTPLGIIRDDENLLRKTAEKALEEYDAVIISGGSSVGEKDATSRVIESLGEMLFHGLAMKPGKPTMLGRSNGKAIVGLPGHPVAALMCTHLFVCPLVYTLEGRAWRRLSVNARLTESLSANHGRAQYNAVRLIQAENGLQAVPIRAKSGLITALAEADGYICIPRDCEGFPAGQEVKVSVFTTD